MSITLSPDDHRIRAAVWFGPLACLGVAFALRFCALEIQGGRCDFDLYYLYSGYVKYLFFLRMFSPSEAFASVIHTLLASMVAPLTFLIARHLKLSERVAWTAGMGVAVLPYYVSTVKSQPQVALTLVLAALSVLIFVLWRERSYDTRFGVLYALVWSYFSYCRPNAVILLPLTLAIYVVEWCFVRTEGRRPLPWTTPIIVAGVILLAFSAMAVETHRTYGYYRPFGPNFGYNLYVGNNENVQRDLARTDIDTLESSAIARNDVPSLDHYDFAADEKLGHAAKQFIATHPAETLHNSTVKALQYWGFRLRNTEPMSSSKNALYVVPYFLYAPFAIAGICFLVSRRRFFALLMTVGIIVVYWVRHAVFFSTIRMRMTTEYLVLILAAQGAWCVLQRDPVKMDGTRATISDTPAG